MKHRSSSLALCLVTLCMLLMAGAAWAATAEAPSNSTGPALPEGAEQPAPTADPAPEGHSTEPGEPAADLDSELFNPAPVYLCQLGQCSDDSQCKRGATCYIAPGDSCGVCIF